MRAISPANRLGGMKKRWMNRTFALRYLPTSSNSEIMPTSTKSIHGVKSFMNLIKKIFAELLEAGIGFRIMLLYFFRRKTVQPYV